MYKSTVVISEVCVISDCRAKVVRIPRLAAAVLRDSRNLPNKTSICSYLTVSQWVGREDRCKLKITTGLPAYIDTAYTDMTVCLQ